MQVQVQDQPYLVEIENFQGEWYTPSLQHSEKSNSNLDKQSAKSRLQVQMDPKDCCRSGFGGFNSYYECCSMVIQDLGNRYLPGAAKAFMKKVELLFAKEVNKYAQGIQKFLGQRAFFYQ